MTEILKCIEEIHAEFPQIPTIRMIEIWFKQQNIPIPFLKALKLVNIVKLYFVIEKIIIVMIVVVVS